MWSRDGAKGLFVVVGLNDWEEAAAAVAKRR
jgi:hypothetical protein